MSGPYLLKLSEHLCEQVKSDKPDSHESTLLYEIGYFSTQTFQVLDLQMITIEHFQVKRVKIEPWYHISPGRIELHID